MAIPAFQDQRELPDDDDGYFAGLRAEPRDTDDSWSRSSTRAASRYEDSRYEDDRPSWDSPSRSSARTDTAPRPSWDSPSQSSRPSWDGPSHAAPTWDSMPEPEPAPQGRPADPYRRGDIVVESNTSPTGWKVGTGVPVPEDDRPPAEATSGNRLFTVMLFFSGLATSISLWLFDTQAGAVNDTATMMLAVGRVSGLIAGYLLFIQLLMMSRVSWLEEWVGSRDLLRWHRWLGTSLLVMVLAHIVTIVYGYALLAQTGVVDQAWSVITTFPEMISATVATGLLVLLSFTSIRWLRTHLPYELWHLIHLTGYVVLLLGYGHQLATGADLSGRFASYFWPGLGALVIAALVWGRIVEPLWLNARHRFSVAEVVAEGANTFSIYIAAKNLDKLPAQAGQFMRWRFLNGNGWWQSHPFSLSAAPNREWLRLTVTVAGGHTSKLGELRPGTPVWAEGPFGTFTAQRRTRRRALLIAGGSGIAPIRALLEDMPSDTIVIYRASRPDELVFRAELEELAEERDAWVRYIVGSRSDPGPRRLFTPNGLRGLVPDVNRRDVYLCGPPGLVEAAVGTLKQLEVPDSQLHLDPFEF
ncbi:ferric reductase-like transmembrane domain-containing protein [Actinoplanes sp. HUAS TT8]|uniref:ferric reductase-like transmembrane domain-containing protein n=1 Tax=Actinoplanes sp. HUAS TT8 TaxID=3447453 RepID=UPI003F51F463